MPLPQPTYLPPENYGQPEECRVILLKKLPVEVFMVVGQVKTPSVKMLERVLIICPDGLAYIVKAVKARGAARLPVLETVGSTDIIARAAAKMQPPPAIIYASCIQAPRIVNALRQLGVKVLRIEEAKVGKKGRRCEIHLPPRALLNTRIT